MGKALNELNDTGSVTAVRRCSKLRSDHGFSLFSRSRFARLLAALVLPAAFVIAGCGGSVAAGISNGEFSITPGTAAIDTNCTGCNATNSSTSVPVEQFSATLNSGDQAPVTWSISGGDANSGAGTISAAGQYTPPAYITANSVQVTITAALTSSPSVKAAATVTITPGFLQPLTPENMSLGSGGSATVTGYIAEASVNSTEISYALSSTANGSSGGQGSLGPRNCTRSGSAFTFCTVTYSAPATVSSTSATYVVATVGTSSSKTSAEILLNTAGVTSDPANHQTLMATPITLGTSGGNNNDYDTKGNQITDCCGGTLGSLIQNSSGTQYVLSCNHVLARSDQASAGEIIVQPGLIDNNCTPNGEGAGTAQVGTLTAWLPLSSSSTNVDAAIAQVDSEAVNTLGEIQELGAVQNGALVAAPPGTSSTGGKGETASLNLSVAKSGRTTGLTCGNISTVSLNVSVSYFKNCAETQPYLTKLYANQIGIEGAEFSDAGDSGSLVVDSNNAEPIGLFFAGGTNSSGVVEGVANPASTVLSELGTQQQTTYTFVGTTDHPVSCLNYGNATAVAAQATALAGEQSSLASQALEQGRSIVNPSAGILGVAAGKSSDHSGEASVVVYVDQSMSVAVPQTLAGVRTQVVPTTPQAVAAGTAPQFAAANALPPLASGILNQAISTKQQIVDDLMKQNPAFFGVGVGQSLDNPKEASLVVYVDRKQIPATLPPIINGLRTRYVVMDRLHVTRSYLATPVKAQSHCMPHSAGARSSDRDPFGIHTPHGLDAF